MFAPPGACVWGPLCTVPATHGHFCPKCSTCTHSTCTYTDVCAFADAQRQRAQNTGQDPATVERQYASDVVAADAPGCPVCRNVQSVQISILEQGGIEAVVRRISGNLAVEGCGGSGATKVRTRATTSTPVQSGTPAKHARRKTASNQPGAVAPDLAGDARVSVNICRNHTPSTPNCAAGARDASNQPGADALEHAGDAVLLGKSGRKRTTSTPRRAGARDAKRMCLGDGVAPTTLEHGSADISAPALAREPVSTATNTKPNTAAVPRAEFKGRDAVTAPPLDHGSADMTAPMPAPPRETVSEASNAEPKNTLVPTVAKAAEDKGLSPAGTSTSRSSSLFVFDDLRALLLQVVICCGYARFLACFHGFLIFCFLCR
jgi:hypothetical protein